MDDRPTSHGIEALIARLHGEGVDAGRREAERLLGEARAAAADLLASARAEAEALRAAARAAADAEREGVDHALELARRDALLALKEELCVQLAGRLRRLVREAIADPALLRRLLLAVVGAEHAPTPAELDALLAEAAGLLLREGASVAAPAGGLRLRLEGDDVIVDVSDATLGALVASHLIPRFRARLDGAHPA